ncbi:hypothetical protein BD408DRAFT_128929 [Parasitella parasitica]|nr:hypothetical protein BD408DRAFT_128929 [Parasitella parasitica]
MDRLPTDFTNTVISAATCLKIPLFSLTLPDSSLVELPRSFCQLPASIAYTLDTSREYCMRPKQSPEFVAHPNLARKFLKLVKQNQIKLAPFFVRTFILSRFSNFGRFPFIKIDNHRVVNVSPFIDSLFPHPSTTSSDRNHGFSPKMYRKLCSAPPSSPSYLPPPFNPNIRPSWCDFWILPISHSCRNVWYRYLQRKIPHKSLLHRFLPEVFTSPSCAICHHPTDSLDHFLFLYSSNPAVWHHIQRTYMGESSASFTSHDLHLILTTFRINNTFNRSSLLIIAATLESIWISHWSFIFNDTPFTFDTIISLANRKILQVRQETFISSGIPHAPASFLFSRSDLKNLKKKKMHTTQNHENRYIIEKTKKLAFSLSSTNKKTETPKTYS